MTIPIKAADVKSIYTFRPVPPSPDYHPKLLKQISEWLRLTEPEPIGCEHPQVGHLNIEAYDKNMAEYKQCVELYTKCENDFKLAEYVVSFVKQRKASAHKPMACSSGMITPESAIWPSPYVYNAVAQYQKK
jgi:hypothetical protein